MAHSTIVTNAAIHTTATIMYTLYHTFRYELNFRMAFLLGLEPRISEPKSDVLPLHHRKITLYLNHPSITGLSI